MKRQQRKLNFLITQTELYAHFMSKKITGDTDVARDQILGRLDEDMPHSQLSIDGGMLTDIAGDDYGGSLRVYSIHSRDKAVDNSNNL